MTRIADLNNRTPHDDANPDMTTQNNDTSKTLTENDTNGNVVENPYERTVKVIVIASDSEEDNTIEYKNISKKKTREEKVEERARLEKKFAKLLGKLKEKRKRQKKMSWWKKDFEERMDAAGHTMINSDDETPTESNDAGPSGEEERH
ncbi:hypothetical protein BJ165DRAFT_1518109 [Panaeolus papilionaceus]|nr:hypothetical protein BJ165DRAFT_1518109 [Panaeolus papilionaceus]